MAKTAHKRLPKRLHDTNDIWLLLRAEVEDLLLAEPVLEKFYRDAVLDHDSFGNALCSVLASRLQCEVLDKATLARTIYNALQNDHDIIDSAKFDLLAFCQRDPACNRYSLPFLYYKGYQGLQIYRVGRWLWKNHHRGLSRFLQSRVSQVFGMDIHPAASIGKGILIDHATSIVIGETAVVGDNVSMLHEVTLGGTGKDTGDRHPKVNSGVLIGTGAKILGNVSIGKNAKVGAGSVVLNDVDDYCTVAGIPAQPVGDCADGTPALEMDHSLDSALNSP
ncbi:serine O-acetyltransferase [Candidatus Spongiihabitans sp.]|uniref:serine O-acetyltransferase n=1 Tax=Candidatus Spongiihabitans sp. TaxID=3101308 RepID=UPI003C6FB149